MFPMRYLHTYVPSMVALLSSQRDVVQKQSNNAWLYQKYIYNNSNAQCLPFAFSGVKRSTGELIVNIFLIEMLLRLKSV